MNDSTTTKQRTLTHYQIASQISYIGLLDGPTGEDAPEWCCPLFSIELDHPYYRLARMFKALRQNDDAEFAKHFSNLKENDIARAKSLLGQISCLKKYLAIGLQDRSLFVVDIWNHGRTGHELHLRLILVKRKSTLKIRRVTKLLPCDVTVDTTGTQQFDEETFPPNETEADLDVYENVSPDTGFGGFLDMLRAARRNNASEFSQYLAPGYRQYTLVGMFMLQSLKRIVTYEEYRAGCCGVGDNGFLHFSKYKLDLTALNWDNQLIQWQVTLTRSHRGWFISKFDN